MKNASVVLNVVLLIAVGILFYLHFSSKNRSTVIPGNKITATGSGDCRIAYFELDSITNSFSMVKDIKAELAQEEDKMNAQMNNLQKMSGVLRSFG